MHKRNPRSQGDRVTESFGRQAKSYAQDKYVSSNEAHSFVIRRQRVCELLDDFIGARVLDIGCGPGVMVPEMANRGMEYFGVDASPEMIRQAEQTFGHMRGVRLSTGRIENLRFPDSHFDAVICMGVIEYLADEHAAIRELARVTKPHGILIVTLPNRLNPYRLWSRRV